MKLKRKNNLIWIMIIFAILLVVLGIIVIVNQNESNKTMKIKIESKELENIVKFNWESSKFDFGNKESTFDNYDIYFNEGIEVRNIEGKIYNIVFTDKYKSYIVNKIKVKDTLENIIEKLGEPNFGGKSIEVIGYKYDDFYIFFNGKEVSIYKNESKVLNTSLIDELDLSNPKESFYKIKEKWTDYDAYSIVEDEGILINGDISYAMKGLRVSYADNKIKLILYNNCNITISENEAYEIERINKNLIYQIELEKKDSIHDLEHVYQISDPYDEDITSEESYEYKNFENKKFVIIRNNYEIDGQHNILFVSLDKQNPNSELTEKVTSEIWLDEYRVIYGINKKGIYLYNVKSFNTQKIIENNNQEFFIKGITEDNELEYDDNTIDISGIN